MPFMESVLSVSNRLPHSGERGILHQSNIPGTIFAKKSNLLLVENVSSCLMFVVVVVAVVGNWTLDLMTPLDDLTLNFDLTKVRLCLVYP